MHNEEPPSPDTALSTIASIPLPSGYHRIQQPSTSFGAWLRQLPLKADKTVYLFNGNTKRNQTAQYAVLDISVGIKDLQQCADAIIRLKAEYLYQQQNYAAIHFNATDGTCLRYEDWRKGYRYLLRQGRLQKVLSGTASTSRAAFMQYLETVFAYAGTQSLQKELVQLRDHSSVVPGDVFIQGGSPGHAVLVADVAQNAAGEKIFLLVQSYMPAQDIHVLINPVYRALSPWYKAMEETALLTPEWYFKEGCLARFAD